MYYSIDGSLDTHPYRSLADYAYKICKKSNRSRLQFSVNCAIMGTRRSVLISCGQLSLKKPRRIPLHERI